MSNFGAFSKESLSKYSSLAAEKAVLEFSEGGTYDFTRCVRPDGTVYGTKGKCRKGTEAEEKEVKEDKSSLRTDVDDYSKEQVKVAEDMMKSNPKFAKVVTDLSKDLNDSIKRNLKAEVEDEDSEYYGDPKAAMQAWYDGEISLHPTDNASWATPKGTALWVTALSPDFDPKDKNTLKQMKETAAAVAEQGVDKTYDSMVNGGF